MKISQIFISILFGRHRIGANVKNLTSFIYYILCQVQNSRSSTDFKKCATIISSTLRKVLNIVFITEKAFYLVSNYTERDSKYNIDKKPFAKVLLEVAF